MSIVLSEPKFSAIPPNMRNIRLRVSKLVMAGRRKAKLLEEFKEYPLSSPNFKRRDGYYIPNLFAVVVVDAMDSSYVVGDVGFGRGNSVCEAHADTLLLKSGEAPHPRPHIHPSCLRAATVAEIKDTLDSMSDVAIWNLWRSRYRDPNGSLAMCGSKCEVLPMWGLSLGVE